MSTPEKPPLPATELAAKLIADSAPLDEVVWGLLPDQARVFLEKGPACMQELLDQLTVTGKGLQDANQARMDLESALQEYATQTGQNALFFDNLQLCLNQVRSKKQG